MKNLQFKPRPYRRKKQQYYTPLLPYFVILFFSFLIAGQCEVLSFYANSLFAIGSLAFIILYTAEIALDFCKTLRFSKIIFRYFRYLCVIVVALGYFYINTQTNPYKNFTVKYAKINIEIESTSSGKYDSRYGIAKIVSAPKELSNIVGSKIWYSIFPNRDIAQKNRDFTTSEIVSIEGLISSTANSTSSFDNYIENRKIFFKISSKPHKVETISEPAKRFVFFEKVRQYMQKSLSKSILKSQENSEAALAYQSMILGDKSKLTNFQRDSFIKTGTMHIFAISGLHIGFAFAMICLILTILNIHWKVQPFISLPLLYLYVASCGFRPSAIRAFSVIALFYLALNFGRGIKALPALIFAGTLTMLISPSIVYDAGFGLSYSIVASIFIYGLPLSNYIMYKTTTYVGDFDLQEFSLRLAIKRYIIAVFSISVGAMFAGSPIIAHYFGEVSLVSAIYSPLFVMGAGVAVSLGFLGFALPNFLSEILNSLAIFIVSMMSDFAQFSYRHFDATVAIKIDNIILAYIVLFGFYAIRYRLANKRSGFLRFVLAPIALIVVMLVIKCIQK